MIFTWHQKIKGKLEFRSEIVKDFVTGTPRGIAVCQYFIHGQHCITVFWIKYFIGMDGLDLSECSKTALLEFYGPVEDQDQVGKFPKLCKRLFVCGVGCLLIVRAVVVAS